MDKRIPDFFKIRLNKERIYGLDILRSMAIIFVVILHGSLILPQRLAYIQFLSIFDGVAVFFVLSGFLIGKILIKTVESSVPTIKTLFHFWVRRWLRTLPNYYLILLILWALTHFLGSGIEGKTIGRYFVFLQNFNTPQPGFFGESWSLSVEEWFYLIVPIIVFGIVRLRLLTPKKAILLTAMLIILFSTGFRYYKYIMLDISGPEEWENSFRKQVLTRLDSIMFGVIGAYFAKYERISWIRYDKLSFKAGLILLSIVKILEVAGSFHFLGLYTYVFSSTLMQVAILSLLPVMSELKSGEGVIYKFLTYISISSYSIYLLHYSVVQIWIVDRFSWFHISGTILVMTKYLAYWSLTIILGILMFKYVEKPMMDLRNKI